MFYAFVGGNGVAVQGYNVFPEVVRYIFQGFVFTCGSVRIRDTERSLAIDGFSVPACDEIDFEMTDVSGPYPVSPASQLKVDCIFQQPAVAITEAFVDVIIVRQVIGVIFGIAGYSLFSTYVVPFRAMYKQGFHTLSYVRGKRLVVGFAFF